MVPNAFASSVTQDITEDRRVRLPSPDSTGDWWPLEVGVRWPVWIGLGALLVLAYGFAAPLVDPDLPMHLATGAWILKHHAVPWVEPFAWTRSGAPYYAYSWLPEVVYQLIYAHAGATGLRALNALTQLAGAAALFWLASVNRWKSWTALLLLFLTVVTSTIVAGFLRPQAFLIPLVLLSWACGIRVLDSAHPRRWAAALAVVVCISANTHLLFPLTGLPLAIAISRTPFPRRRAAMVAASLIVGWLVTPYGLVWPKVFSLYFGHNALFDYPSPIKEFTPGFRAVATYPLWLFIAGVLALTPWAFGEAKTTSRERMVFGGIWFVGLTGFGMAARGIVVWWFATLPMLAVVLEQLPRPRRGWHRRVLIGTIAALPIVLAVRLAQAGAKSGWDVAPAVRPSVDGLATWLEQHVQPPAGTRPRMLTDFDFGSYLTWRLPAYSMSIDGRTIFPDSVALADAYRDPYQTPAPLGPWRSADLAILPLAVPVAGILDTARGWVRLATVPAGARVHLPAGLWAREGWLRSALRSSSRHDRYLVSMLGLSHRAAGRQ